MNPGAFDDMTAGRTPPFEPAPEERTGRKRNSCKVIVLDSGRILFTLNRDREGGFLMLPGGGQRFGETLVEAARRETMEETGLSVEVRGLLLVREYIGANHEFASEDGDAHQTEFLFEAVLVPGDPGGAAASPSIMDTWQTGIAWIRPEDLAGFRIYPSVLASILPAVAAGTYGGPVYLGDVN
ncbi:MAG: NUDIX domain-containing protein [Candidatus Fermentibacter sp.]|nr:NUDIX domain-containing protein [Candidatus Fermentibacter sp.]